MNEFERQQAEYRATPAGMFQQAFGITEVRDLAARDAFIAEVRARKEDAYKRELYPEEARALEFAAEAATTTVHQAIPSPVTSWELAQRLRWGVQTPVPKELAIGEMRPLAGAR